MLNDAQCKIEFLKFEKEIDEEVSKFELLKLPIRTVLTSFYGLIDNFFHGHPLHSDKIIRNEMGSALASRLSYLNQLFIKCPLEPIGVSATNALSPMTPERFEEVKFLVAYSHFSELVPEARNGYYKIDKSGKKFNLTFINEDFEKYEIIDRVLNELSLPFLIDKPIEDISYFNQQVETLPKIDLSGLVIFVQSNIPKFLKQTFELTVIPSGCLEEILGVSFEQFQNFRACWMAISQFHIEMARAISTKVKETDVKLLNEFLEWQTPYLEESFLAGLIITNACITKDQYFSLMEIYCIDYNNKKSTAGDGFSPPIQRLKSGLLFQPNMVQIMMSSRNIPYAINKLHKKKFDEILSPALEPHFLIIVKKIFDKLNVLTSLNVNWEHGEIDLLVYDSNVNVALQIQAKAIIPPQGSRLVRNLESQMKYGIDQLNRFEDLSQTKKDEIISNAIGKDVKDVITKKVLMGWSCFGTSNIWTLFTDICPINIALLYILVERQPKDLFVNFYSYSMNLISEIVDGTNPKWVNEKLFIKDIEIEFPNLLFDEQTLLQHKKYLIEFGS